MKLKTKVLSQSKGKIMWDIQLFKLNFDDREVEAVNTDWRKLIYIIICKGNQGDLVALFCLLPWHKLTQGVLVLDSVSVPILDNGCTGFTIKGGWYAGFR